MKRIDRLLTRARGAGGRSFDFAGELERARREREEHIAAGTVEEYDRGQWAQTMKELTKKDLLNDPFTRALVDGHLRADHWEEWMEYMKRINRLLRKLRNYTSNAEFISLCWLSLQPDGTIAGFTELWDGAKGGRSTRSPFEAQNEAEAMKKINELIAQHPTPDGEDPVIIFDDIY